MTFKIGKLSAETGVNVDTIRYYERQGLVLPSHRERSGYRYYTQASINEVEFIKRAQQLGFSLPEIKQLLDYDANDDNNSEVLALIKSKSKEIGEQLADIAHINRTLDLMHTSCRPAKPGESFLDSLFATPQRDIVDRHACVHTYALQEATWNFKGTIQQYDKPQVTNISGTQTVSKEEKIWSILREIDFDEPGQGRGVFEIFLPAVTHESDVIRFVANCSTFGDVVGTVGFAGEVIFMNYDMTDVGYKCSEHLRKVNSDMYEVTGIISGEDRAILKWRYLLERS